MNSTSILFTSVSVASSLDQMISLVIVKWDKSSNEKSLDISFEFALPK